MDVVSPQSHRPEGAELLLRAASGQAREVLARAVAERERAAAARKAGLARLDEWAEAMSRAAGMAAAGSPGYRGVLGEDARAWREGDEAVLRFGAPRRGAEIRAGIGENGRVSARLLRLGVHQGVPCPDLPAAEALDRALGRELFHDALLEGQGMRRGGPPVAPLLAGTPTAPDDGALAHARALDAGERDRRGRWFAAAARAREAHAAAAAVAVSALREATGVPWVAAALPGLRWLEEPPAADLQYVAWHLPVPPVLADAPPVLALVADTGPDGGAERIASLEGRVFDGGNTFGAGVVLAAHPGPSHGLSLAGVGAVADPAWTRLRIEIAWETTEDASALAEAREGALRIIGAAAAVAEARRGIATAAPGGRDEPARPTRI